MSAVSPFFLPLSIKYKLSYHFRMTNKTLANQMAVLNNNFDETADSASFAENSLLNATCPARIQNNTSASERANTSMNDGDGCRRAPLSRRVKREPLRITPLAQIDEVPAHRRHGKVSGSVSSLV